MSSEAPIIAGQYLEGPLFSEPMRVETVRSFSAGSWSVGLVGTRSNHFRSVVLTSEDVAALDIKGAKLSYDGDGRLLRLGLEARLLGLAHEFDPYFGISISRVDPLPHQLEAVYGHLLKLSTVRFLLADDAGAGKTIMAGLLVRELKLRGLVDRILVVCPASLTFQWQRELREKFDEKFIVLKGGDIREQYGVNQWQENQRIITSLDLAKRPEILSGLSQVHWDLVIIDEAHRMSWTPPSGKTARYALGELLRDRTDHILLLTATPHKGDQENFTRFMQLIDRDAYADVKSIHEAMKQRIAPFYLRRTKEAMVYFPERQPDGEWRVRPVFTKRTTHTAGFAIDNAESELYSEVTRFVKKQSVIAASCGDTPRARAVGFLMALYQRRLASSTCAVRRSLENRVRRLQERLTNRLTMFQNELQHNTDQEELEEMEDAERENLEIRLAGIAIGPSLEQVRDEIGELKLLANKARAVEAAGDEAKLSKLRDIMQKEGFFDSADQRLLLFTEFKDTLDYLMDRLKDWGFRVGCIHGRMKPGSRDEPGTRLYTEQQFREGSIQVLVATEAAGEGINLQCCHILFNYDIPWNPNRLEQRMGRIHRYGQRHDCLIFNFVATNTIEGRVLNRLMEKLREIRNALDDDTVFNVVGEVLPAAHIESVLLDYYAGKLGEEDLEESLLREVDVKRFREICHTALEGLATRELNLDMLVERRAKAQEQRVVPENISRFMADCAEVASLRLKPVKCLAHAFDLGPTPPVLKRYERASDWALPQLSLRYPRMSTDRSTADNHHLEWVTPGHPLFESLRRHVIEAAKDAFFAGSCFYSLSHVVPARIDVYQARAVDGKGRTICEKLFAVESLQDCEPQLRVLRVLDDLIPAEAPDPLPESANLPDPDEWLARTTLNPFVDRIRAERLAEVERIAKHVDVSLTEVLQRLDDDIGRISVEVDNGKGGAEGRLAQAEKRHGDALERRDRRREELMRERSVTLQGVEKITSALILPHPERDAPSIKRLRPNPETEMIAMRVVMDHEMQRGCRVEDVHKQNLGYDVTSLNLRSGELRLIEVKGLAATSGEILLTPNERRVAEDRRDCYWLYMVTDCAQQPTLREPIKDPARRKWEEVSKVQHYRLSVDEIAKPLSAGEAEDQAGKPAE